MASGAGRVEEAIGHFQRSVALDPQGVAAWFNLGNARCKLRQPDEAIESYLAALRLAPADADIHTNLGASQLAAGRRDEARASLQRALALRSDHAEAWMQLGFTWHAENNLERAVDCFRRAVEAQPKSAAAHNALGTALRAGNQLDEAIECFQRALAIDANYATAHKNLGEAREAEGSTAQAVDCYRQALALTGGDALKIKCALTLPVIVESRHQIEQCRERLSLDLQALGHTTLQVDDPAASDAHGAFPLAYHGRNERAFQAQIAALWRRSAPVLDFTAAHCRAGGGKPRGQRIKIGFVSAHLRQHTIGKLNAGLIGRMNREAFEVAVVCFDPPGDALARHISDAAERTLVLARSLPLAQRRLADERFDALLYTDIGIDGFTYFLAHARLAPVQCVTWGHPLTTGIPTIDYFISSEDLEPAGADAHYTERLARLPGLANYYFRPEPSTSVRSPAEFGLPEDAHVYACLQSLFKLHPDDDDLWAEILRRDPQSRLVLLEGNFTNWTRLARARFARSIPDVADRIVFISHQPPAEFSRLLSLVDVLLDPLHFGGGDTSYQSFAVGTPVVTLPGGFLRSRITYALYRAMGLDECVATSAADYVERAVRLGTDREHRERVRAKILAANHAVYENPAAVEYFENFLLDAVGKSMGHS
jgi:predicted O-linked N-acetylglucosamine transferase (SPINDLY family)